MEIKSLRDTGFDEIHKAFSKAFADYEVKVNKEEFRTMIERRGFDPKLSFAAFDDGEIVSMTLTGIGQFEGVPTAYDTGTGTLKEYRGQGLAAKVFDYSVPYLKEAGIEQYLLEVLQHNESAVKVYRRVGFEVSREFKYFYQDNDKVAIDNDLLAENCTVKKIGIDICRRMDSFWEFYPSWQNSFESVERKLEDFVILGAYVEGEPRGYCIFDPQTGDVTQIAVRKSFRRMGIGRSLLKEVLKLNKHSSVKVINTDIEDITIEKFLKSCNITEKGKQFEMIKKL